MPLLETEDISQDFSGIGHDPEGPSKGRGNMKEQLPRQGLGNVILWASGCCKMPQFYVTFVSASGAKAYEEKMQAFLEEEIQKNLCFH